MLYKKSSELENMFLVNRDVIKTLVKDKVLKPESAGEKGKTAKYGPDDVTRLIDVKMCLLAGYEISNVQAVINENDDAKQLICDQIREYKRNIQMLEYFLHLREYSAELIKLPQAQADDIVRISAAQSSLPDVGCKGYFDLYCDLIQLIFAIDYLCKKESINESEDALRCAISVLQIIEKIPSITGLDIDYEKMAETAQEITNASAEEDIKKEIKQKVGELKEKRESIIEILMQAKVDPVIDELEKDSSDLFSEMMFHTFEFILDYICDEEALYCLYQNVKRLFNELDLIELSKGEIKLLNKNIKSVMRKKR